MSAHFAHAATFFWEGLVDEFIKFADKGVDHETVGIDVAGVRQALPEWGIHEMQVN